MERIRKTWGVKTEIFRDSTCEVSLLHLDAYQRCSWHKHQAKYNQFYVISGEISVLNEYDETNVKEGQVFTTSPGEWHEFRTHNQKALVIEIMYVRYDPEDIERKQLGGPLHAALSEASGDTGILDAEVQAPMGS